MNLTNIHQGYISDHYRREKHTTVSFDKDLIHFSFPSNLSATVKYHTEDEITDEIHLFNITLDITVTNSEQKSFTFKVVKCHRIININDPNGYQFNYFYSCLKDHMSAVFLLTNKALFTICSMIFSNYTDSFTFEPEDKRYYYCSLYSIPFFFQSVHFSLKMENNVNAISPTVTVCNDHLLRRRIFTVNVNQPEKTVQEIIKFIFKNIDKISKKRDCKEKDSQFRTNRINALIKLKKDKKVLKSALAANNSTVSLEMNIKNEDQFEKLIDFINQNF